MRSDIDEETAVINVKTRTIIEQSLPDTYTLNNSKNPLMDESMATDNKKSTKDVEVMTNPGAEGGGKFKIEDQADGGFFNEEEENEFREMLQDNHESLPDSGKRD